MDTTSKLKSVSEILERYQDFVNELLRLSLLGIAGIGFFITTFAQKPSSSATLALTGCSKFLLSLSLILFGIAAAAGLASRFLIAESLAYHFSALRLKDAQDSDPADIQHANTTREKRFTDSRRAMTLSAITLGCGAACLAVGFVLTLYSPA